MDAAALSLLADFFDGSELRRKSGLAAYVVTVAEDGWPHSAMISVGELLVRADGSARMALWAGSRSSANVTRNGQAVVLVVLRNQSVRANLRLHPVDSDDRLARFDGGVEAVVAERAPYADLVEGVTFRLHDEVSTLRRWTSTLLDLANP